VLVITILSLALPGTSGFAQVVLDKSPNPATATFVYPFTIQNFMTMLLFLGLGDIFHRYVETKKESKLLTLSLLPEDDKTVLMAEDLAGIRKRLTKKQVHGSAFLFSIIDECVLRFQSARAIDQTHNVLDSMVDLEMHRLDLRYTLLRYLSWLIPTIGFIGTVVGIWLTLKALGMASDNIASDIGKLAGTLAMAFTTTMMALIQSAVLVGFIHVVQYKEESGINSASKYCLKNLINRLYIPNE
jgi:biopolymer transport protein ExbB/TolQ